MADITLKPKLDTQELDEAIEKATRLVELLHQRHFTGTRPRRKIPEPQPLKA